jgi:hypothetical protein
LVDHVAATTDSGAPLASVVPVVDPPAPSEDEPFDGGAYVYVDDDVSPPDDDVNDADEEDDDDEPRLPPPIVPDATDDASPTEPPATAALSVDAPATSVPAATAGVRSAAPLAGTPTPPATAAADDRPPFGFGSTHSSTRMASTVNTTGRYRPRARAMSAKVTSLRAPMALA